MSWIKKNKNKIIVAAAVLIALVFVFWWGGNSPNLHGWNIVSSPSPVPFASVSENSEYEATDDKVFMENSVPVQEPQQTGQPQEAETTDIPIKKTGEPATPENKPERANDNPLSAEEKTQIANAMAEGLPSNMQTGNKAYSEEVGMEINETTGKDQFHTEPVPDGKPVPIEPQEVEITDKELTCTLLVNCSTILQNIAWLDPEKVELVPQDGIIFAEQTVTFYEGESVFNLLVREMKKNKIHMEFENTPIYNSAYIEGIGNLYEYDCGELSGWMYKVNGWFPNYGCSRYQLKAGDKVEWVYTCDLGNDVGGQYAASGE